MISSLVAGLNRRSTAPVGVSELDLIVGTGLG
jgi:hypothetical protein